MREAASAEDVDVSILSLFNRMCATGFPIIEALAAAHKAAHSGLRAIIIDPFKKTITEVTLDNSEGDAGYKAIKKAIGDNWITSVRLSDKDILYVDDEGLLKGIKTQQFFEYQGYPQSLAGMGCIVGCNDEGESTPCSLSIEQVQANVRWVNNPHYLQSEPKVV